MTELYSPDELESLTIQPEMLPPDVAQFFEPALCGTCYACHIVECFRHVRRVLRDDGVLWLNLGDNYNNRTKVRPTSHQPALNGYEDANWRDISASGGVRMTLTSAGLKEKDLMMMPFRVAMALQADGWWLRSVIPWLKRNAMPESVTDRPATSIEYVFLLSKAARYFWDADAVRMASNPDRKYWKPGDKCETVNDTTGRDVRNDGLARLGQRMNDGLASGRNRRNGDWFFESWQGLMLDEQDDPLAIVVNPQPFSGAHFATFPTRLVEPMVKASTRPGDTILDPFAGSGTVGLVADRLGRDAVLCELKPSYAEMGADRIVGDSPMFTEVSA